MKLNKFRRQKIDFVRTVAVDLYRDGLSYAQIAEQIQIMHQFKRTRQWYHNLLKKSL